MATSHLKLGPADHGRMVAADDFEAADFQCGFKYEIIDGCVYVSPFPDPPENFVETWLYGKLLDYRRANPTVLNHLTGKARVHVAGRPGVTIAGPDLAAYSDWPLERRFRGLKWSDVSPVLVCEILVGDPEKDLTRNVELYLAVPSIKEYWVLDARDDPQKPTLIQHRRHGKRWVVRSFPFGSTFTTKLLPGFELVIDPHR